MPKYCPDYLAMLLQVYLTILAQITLQLIINHIADYWAINCKALTAFAQTLILQPYNVGLLGQFWAMLKADFNSLR